MEPIYQVQYSTKQDYESISITYSCNQFVANSNLLSNELRAFAIYRTAR